MKNVKYVINQELSSNPDKIADSKTVAIFNKSTLVAIRLNKIEKALYKYTVTVYEMDEYGDWEYIITIRADEFLNDSNYMNYIRD